MLVRYMISLFETLGLNTGALGRLMMVIPFFCLIQVHYIVYFLVVLPCEKTNTRKKFGKKQFRTSVMAMIAPNLLLLQCTVSLLYGMIYGILDKQNKYIAPFVCATYPIAIGALKHGALFLVKDFGVQEIYQFTSLTLAAMPYRFLFLSVDNVFSVVVILVIKFVYKMGAYFVIPFYFKRIDQARF